MPEQLAPSPPTNRRPSALEEIRAGLSRRQKELAPKFFYDQRGSELFERITKLPEYYPTRAERIILRSWMPRLVPALGIQTLVELGAGSAEKSRVILDAMQSHDSAFVYVPIDVSAAFLQDTARRLGADYPRLSVLPTVADLTRPLHLPRRLPRPALFAFLGSTIGNFAAPKAIALLERLGAVMEREDYFLLGADLRKNPAVLEAAYNDGQGVTAAFNLNALRVLNREFAANFDLSAFDHWAYYDRTEHRIEMHLVSKRPQRVTIPGAGTFAFRAGETVRTEISCKYDRSSVEALLSQAGLELTDWRTDPDDLFALALARIAS